MKKSLIIFLILALTIFMFACNSTENGITPSEIESSDITPSESSASEVISSDAIISEAVSSEAITEEEQTSSMEQIDFKFTNYTDISGDNRIVEPLFAEFIEIEIEKGKFIMSEDEIRITGYLQGNENLNSIFFPDSGLMATLEAFIFDGNDIVWKQKGYLVGDTYIKNNDKKEFLLINEGKLGDKLILIAYVTGGMFEDDGVFDRGIFAIYEVDFTT